MKQGTIYALGFFDGVHLGHQALLRACRRMSDELGCKAGVVTFIGHPDTLISGVTPPLINTPADRAMLLRQFGVDTVVELTFDETLRNMSWVEFLVEMSDRYHACGFVCGDDFRFGYKGRGNAQSMAEYCETEWLPYAVVPQQDLDGIRVSSTYIRQLLEQGEMERAAEFLGHRHILTGTVVPGRRLGRSLGTPTANLVVPTGVLVPKFGVYICRCTVDGVSYPAVTNVGTRPTVEGTNVTVEPWLLDFEGDLYGKELTLEFYKFLRPERKFPSLEELRAEIQKNGAQTRKYFEKT